MRVVTTVHKAGFEQYGHRWVQSIRNVPADEFVIYMEGFADRENASYAAAKYTKNHPSYPSVPLIVKTTESTARLKAFKEAHAWFIAPSWRYDIVRFSNKVFAAYDALYDYDGIGVWLDADAVTFNPIPRGYIEAQLEGVYLAHFKRDGWYTETGMWVMDCSKPGHKAFLDKWVEWFESGSFVKLHEWHDCTTLDATIRQTGVKTRSLSGEFSKDMHPMAKADIGRYIDHCKGPRKIAGFSPENGWAEAMRHPSLEGI